MFALLVQGLAIRSPATPTRHAVRDACAASADTRATPAGTAATKPPYAKISIIARGAVSPEAVADRLTRMHEAIVGILDTMAQHPDCEADGCLTIEIRRTAAALEEDEEASISTSLIMSMTNSAGMV